MEEVRRNNTAKIEFGQKRSFEGVVVDYIPDRIMVSLDHANTEISKELKELDKIFVTVFTPLGVKTMKSHILSPVDSKGCIVVENIPSAEIVQRREFVRVVHDFKFEVTTSKHRKITCKCLNVSAGGIAFLTDRVDLSTGEIIDISFPDKLFDKPITCKAEVIGEDKNYKYIAKYVNLNSFDEDRIVKFVFKLITEDC